MRNLITTLLSTGILSMLFNGDVIAQQPGNDSGQLTAIGIHYNATAGNEHSAARPSSAINVKAMRHFLKSFKQADSVHWYKSGDGLMVYFKEAGIKTRVGYNRKGVWLYNLRSYPELQLPKNIRSEIKSIYFDFCIFWVNEISTSQKKLIYLIYMEDKTCYKTIKYDEGEQEIIEQLSKQ
jgi:hypothetical protein